MDKDKEQNTKLKRGNYQKRREKRLTKKVRNEKRGKTNQDRKEEGRIKRREKKGKNKQRGSGIRIRDLKTNSRLKWWSHPEKYVLNQNVGIL